MTEDLQALLADAVDSGWAEEPSKQLAAAIEVRIVAELPSRLRAALGNDEAAQMARVVAWERCRRLAERLPASQVTWGYLANMVRWRLADVVRQEARRRQRHPLLDYVPDSEEPSLLADLGPMLDRVGMRLENAGLPVGEVRRRLVVAADGPGFSKHAIAGRLRAVGVPKDQAEGLAWLLHNGSIRTSALSRLAGGQSPDSVFADPAVRQWIDQAVGRLPRTSYRSRRFGRPPGASWHDGLGLGLVLAA
ncbi:hypothetical protein JOF29_006042 [Kribbella aluminosa]|uniref:Sigma-70 family RNA polymerase sigma factor n=1 Tax=Kribbella aluminosa TaxID=416017 RepID=A0ABS4UTH0_9ACTN|nr:hypothetical protein [Kribbella aluminosa]MBP2354932.1 hypothetical protein [Kribbella aluminosa]